MSSLFHTPQTTPPGYQRLVAAEFRPREQLTAEERQRWLAHEEVMATAFATFRDQAEPRRYEDLWLVRQAAYLQLKGLELRQFKYIVIVIELIDDFEQPAGQRPEYRTVLMLGNLWQPVFGGRPRRNPLGESRLLASFEDVMHIQLWSPFVLKRIEVGVETEDISPLAATLTPEAALVPGPLATMTRLTRDGSFLRPIRLNSCTITVLGPLLPGASGPYAARTVNGIPYPILHSQAICMREMYLEETNNPGSPCPSDVSDMSEYLREHPPRDLQ